MQINTPIVNAPNLYAYGLQMAWFSDTEISVSAGGARDSTNVNDIILTNPTVLNAMVVGINGRDADTNYARLNLYYIYVVGDSTMTHQAGLILSSNLTAPALPSGYDMFRLIGFISTSSAGNIFQFYQTGTSNDRTIMYQANQQVLSDGASTSFASVPLLPIVPPVSGTVIINANYIGNAAINKAQISTYNPTSISPMINLAGETQAITGNWFNFEIIFSIELNQSFIMYKTTSLADSLTMNVIGYKYSI